MTEDSITREISEKDTIDTIYDIITHVTYKSGMIKRKEITTSQRQQIAEAIYAASQKYSLDIALIMAIIETESSWRPNVVSHKGARGLMQIMPVWTKELYDIGIIENPGQLFGITKNIQAGCYIFNDYLWRWCLMESCVMAYPEEALRQYNTGSREGSKAGEIYVAKVREAKERIEEFLNAI